MEPIFEPVSHLRMELVQTIVQVPWNLDADGRGAPGISVPRQAMSVPSPAEFHETDSETDAMMAFARRMCARSVIIDDAPIKFSAIT
jgi:hypothetical protein